MSAEWPEWRCLPQMGDLAIVRDAGAYGATMSSNYNSRPLVPELMLDGDRVTAIRKRQSIEPLLELEVWGSSEGACSAADPSAGECARRVGLAFCVDQAANTLRVRRSRWMIHGDDAASGKRRSNGQMDSVASFRTLRL